MSLSAVTVAIEADFDRDGAYETDLSTYAGVVGGGWSIGRGINPDGTMKVSELKIGLDNDSGIFTPEYSSSSLYGQLEPHVPLRLTATHLGVTYTVWTGYVIEYKQKFGRPGTLRCDIRAQDLGAFLAGYTPVNVNVASRTTDAALIAIAAAIGLSADDYVFPAGAQTLPLHWARNADAMSAMMDVVRSEMGGLLFVDAAGRLTLLPRRLRLGTSFYRQQVLLLDPIAYWRLGETSGTSALDASGNGHTGTYTHSPTLGQAAMLTGDAGLAVSLDGTNDFVSVAHNAAFNVTSFSIAGWVDASSIPNAIMTLAGKDSENAYFLRVTNNAGGNKLQGFVVVATAAGTPAESAGAFTTGVHHVAMTYDGTNITLYVDGAQTGQQPRSGTPDTNSNPFYLGTAAGGAQCFGGKMQDWALWDTALTATQVLALYNAGHLGRVWGDAGTAKPESIDYVLNDDDLITKAMVQVRVFTEGDPTAVIFVFSRNASNAVPDSISIPPATALPTILLDFASPTESLVAAVAYTDYTASTAIDGLGTDRTSSLSVTATLQGAGFALDLENTHATDTIYVTKLQLRGLPQDVSPDRPVFLTEKSIPNAKLDQGVSLDVPFGDLTVPADDYSAQVCYTYRYPYPQVVLHFGWDSDAVALAMLSVELGDLVKYADKTSGNAAWLTNVDDYWRVEAIKHAGRPGGAFTSEITLVPSYLYRDLDHIVYDGFDRADAVGDLGTSLQGAVWANDTLFDISGGKARPNSDSLGVPYLDLGTGAYDQVVQVSVSNLAADADVQAGVSFRLSDTSNFWAAFVSKSSNQFVLRKVVAGVGTSVATASWAPADTVEIRVIAQGNRIRVWGDRRLVIDYSDAFNAVQATKCGLRAANASGTVLFDDFQGQGL